MTTERLYYADSHLTEFTAQVTSVEEAPAGRTSVRLDRTAFYPTGGGQPSDTGTLAQARVVECVDEEDEVRHLIEGHAPQVGELVECRIDRRRRLDHLQQHTGQHILSQSFVELFGAETRSFRMMERVSEIDLALAAPTDERIEQAVDLANRIIWEDRAVRVRQVTPAEAAMMPLRKDSARAGELRIIEIERFDLSPCGGTHAARTGEVGLLAVRSWERAKGLTRIQFVAGMRALADYRLANRTARDVAALFSVGRDEAADAVARLQEETRQLARRLRPLEELAARVEAEELLAQAASRSADGARIVICTFDGRDADSLKRLAQALVSHPQTIALLSSREPHQARLVFARSADLPDDMDVLLRQTCDQLGGRGGGRPHLAQGGGQNLAQLPSALDTAARRINQA